MLDELPEEDIGIRLGSRTTYGAWRIRDEIEKKYNIDCPEWLEETPYAGGDWELVREITPTLGLYRHPPTLLSETPSPSTHRPATVFENELHEMTEAAIPLLEELFDSDAVVTEMPYASNFRTDLVFCQVDSEKLKRRIAITGDTVPLNEEWRYLKAHRYLRDRAPITYNEFIEGPGPYVEQTSKQVWNWLDQRNLIASAGREFYTVLDYPIHVTAHAVELKRRDWKKALEQVQRSTHPAQHTDHWASNRNPKKYGYADYQWVGIDAGQIPNVLEHIDEFEKTGVGLLGIDNGGVVKLVEAEKKDPYERSIDREHINEKSLAQIDEVDFDVDNVETPTQSQMQLTNF